MADSEENVSANTTVDSEVVQEAEQVEESKADVDQPSEEQATAETSEEEATAEPSEEQATAETSEEEATAEPSEEQVADPSDTSPDKPFRIPKLSERSESTENMAENIPENTEDNTAAEVSEDDATIQVSVEEEQHSASDTELLVDETMVVQSEVNNEKTEPEKEPEKESTPKSKKENGSSHESRRSRKRSRSRSRSRSRHRSRSRSRSHDRRRREKYQDIRDTSSDHPDMIRSRVFVGHLDTDRVTKDEVHHLFSAYGRVVGIALHQGYGFVQYDNADSAKAAIKEAHGTPVKGMKIVVDKTVKLKKLLGEDPHSEPPLPKSPPRLSRREKLDEYDLDYMRRRDLHNRYTRLEELERRILYDRYERFPPPPPRRDPYLDSYYERPAPPPSYMDSYERTGPRYDYERERERERLAERDRYAAAAVARERDMYYERRRDDYHDDYRGSSDYPTYRY